MQSERSRGMSWPAQGGLLQSARTPGVLVFSKNPSYNLAMQEQEIFVRIRDILTSQFDVDDDKISMDSNLYEELDIDSIDAVDLLVQLKEFTGAKVAPEAFKDVRTIRDVMQALNAL